MKIFAIGATGYIGGDAFYILAHAHPEHEYTCLVRNSDKGAQIVAQYPKVRLVYGELDNAELIKEESSKADIVCNWAHADHEVAARAITQGLAAKSSPGYLIHVSGTGILLFKDVDRDIFGEEDAEVYDDWDGISKVTSLPDHAPHRNVDKVVIAAGSSNPNVKTAILCPPCIYGQGRGPSNQTSHQVPELSRATIEQGHGIKVGAGKTFWPAVHVHDLSDASLKLVEAAANNGEPATWGAEGYYFIESEEFVWGDVAQWVADAAKDQGFISTNEVKSVSKDEAGKLTPWGNALWGANSRARAVRARRLLGWNPQSPSLKDEVPATVTAAATKLGRKPGHAQVAAGTV